MRSKATLSTAFLFVLASFYLISVALAQQPAAPVAAAASTAAPGQIIDPFDPANPIAPPLPPTTGELRIYDTSGTMTGICPLKHTDVQADIVGYVARVKVVQTFSNPSDKKIEASYVFPLPHEAAVDGMTMTIGERMVVAEMKPREEARVTFEVARSLGYTASLLEQERPNIFTQSVTNIEPGAQIKIEISYDQTLKPQDEGFQFVFPMVVGPRFIPAAQSTMPRSRATTSTLVKDAAAISPPITPQGTRAGHDISLSVTIDAGMGLSDVKSTLHAVDIIGDASKSRVTLKNQNEIPNKDFILNYKIAPEKLTNTLYVHSDTRGNFFTLVLQPPARVTPQQAVPKELVFVIDRSGSMRGAPIEKAKETMKLCIEQMNPDDKFDFVSFSTGVEDYMGNLVPNTPDNRKKALDILANLEGTGGTNMIPGLEIALGDEVKPEQPRVVCFMTDGFVGNDMQVLDLVKKYADKGRMFSFGVGNSVNRYLLDGMAKAGRGDVQFVTLNDPADQSAKLFAERIQSPVLTDISLDWGNLDVEEVYPAHIPDVFSRTPIMVHGRIKGQLNGTVTLKGKTSAGPYEQRISVSPAIDATPHEVLPMLWARAKVDDLMLQDLQGVQRGNPNPAVKEKIEGVGVAYNIMTQFTSFVAVEVMNVTVAGEPTKVRVPVEMPEGTSYEGVIGGKVNASSARFTTNRRASLSDGLATGASGQSLYMLRGSGIARGGAATGGGGGAGGVAFGGGTAGGGRGRSGRGGRGAQSNGAQGGALGQAQLGRSETGASAAQGSGNVKSLATDKPASAANATAARPDAGRYEMLTDSLALDGREISGDGAAGVSIETSPTLKLTPALRNLAAAVVKDGREGTLTVGAIKVLAYRVDVMITYRELTEAAQKSLDELGFKKTAESKTTRLLIGSIDVRKLEDLAKLNAVLRVEPVSK